MDYSGNFSAIEAYAEQDPNRSTAPEVFGFIITPKIYISASEWCASVALA